MHSPNETTLPLDTDDLQALARRDVFATHIGIEAVDGGNGAARTRLRVAPRHLNGLGVVQGGVLFTLADLAFALAANSRGTKVIGLNAQINWLRPTCGGTVTAEATEVSCGRTIATYLVRVTDEDGALLATFHGTGYRLGAVWERREIHGTEAG